MNCLGITPNLAWYRCDFSYTICMWFWLDVHPLLYLLCRQLDEAEHMLRSLLHLSHQTRVKQGFQSTSVPFTTALTELRCHRDANCRSSKQVHAGVMPQGFNHGHISKGCHYMGSGVGSLESSHCSSHLHPLAHLPLLLLSPLPTSC